MIDVFFYDMSSTIHQPPPFDTTPQVMIDSSHVNYQAPTFGVQDQGLVPIIGVDLAAIAIDSANNVASSAVSVDQENININNNIRTTERPRKRKSSDPDAVSEPHRRGGGQKIAQAYGNVSDDDTFKENIPVLRQDNAPLSNPSAGHLVVCGQAMLLGFVTASVRMGKKVAKGETSSDTSLYSEWKDMFKGVSCDAAASVSNMGGFVMKKHIMKPRKVNEDNNKSTGRLDGNNESSTSTSRNNDSNNDNDKNYTYYCNSNDESHEKDTSSNSNDNQSKIYVCV